MKTKFLDDAQSWYEVGLPAEQRKQRGHFSTPPALVKHILDACGYTSEADLANIRVLDPACGSGNFLLEAARRLLRRGVMNHARTGIQQALTDGIDQTLLVQRNLWGFDPDPVACFLTELQLRSILNVGEDVEGKSQEILRCAQDDNKSAQDGSESAEDDNKSARDGSESAEDDNKSAQDDNKSARDDGESAQDDNKSAQDGSESVRDDGESARDGSENTLHDIYSLHIHQADALALSWKPCVDLLLANPPYLAAKNSDLSGYQSAHQRGQADSYLLFLSLALQALRPGGWMGLVLPDPVLARANATRERQRLLEEMTVHHLWHLADVFAADVGAVVIIAQKSPPSSLHQVSWVRGRWQDRGVMNHARTKIQPVSTEIHHVCTNHASAQVPQGLLQRQPGAELRYLLNTSRGNIIECLRQQMDEFSGGVMNHARTHYVRTHHAPTRRLAPLSEFLTISRGEELGKNSQFITNWAEQDGGKYPYGRDSSRPAGCCTGLPGRDESRPYEGFAYGMATVSENNGHIENDYHPYPILLGGSDIRPYSVPVATHCIERSAIVKPLERYLSAKLLVVKSTDRLQAALDMQGHVALQTLYLLHPRNRDTSEDDLYFFLALLNSRLLSEYVYMLHTAYKWVQPQIEQSVLARLPVPLVAADERQKIIQISKTLVDACSGGDVVVEWNQSHIYEEQERSICALYETVVPGLFAI